MQPVQTPISYRWSGKNAALFDRVVCENTTSVHRSTGIASVHCVQGTDTPRLEPEKRSATLQTKIPGPETANRWLQGWVDYSNVISSLFSLVLSESPALLSLRSTISCRPIFVSQLSHTYRAWHPTKLLVEREVIPNMYRRSRLLQKLETNVRTVKTPSH